MFSILGLLAFLVLLPIAVGLFSRKQRIPG
jgi:hypothetical protein